MFKLIIHYVPIVIILQNISLQLELIYIHFGTWHEAIYTWKTFSSILIIRGDWK